MIIYFLCVIKHLYVFLVYAWVISATKYQTSMMENHSSHNHFPHTYMWYFFPAMSSLLICCLASPNCTGPNCAIFSSAFRLFSEHITWVYFCDRYKRSSIFSEVDKPKDKRKNNYIYTTGKESKKKKSINKNGGLSFRSSL